MCLPSPPTSSISSTEPGVTEPDTEPVVDIGSLSDEVIVTWAPPCVNGVDIYSRSDSTRTVFMPTIRTAESNSIRAFLFEAFSGSEEITPLIDRSTPSLSLKYAVTGALSGKFLSVLFDPRVLVATEKSNHPNWASALSIGMIFTVHLPDPYRLNVWIERMLSLTSAAVATFALPGTPPTTLGTVSPASARETDVMPAMTERLPEWRRGVWPAEDIAL